MIRIVSVALPKSPTNLAQGDEVSQIITPITRQRPSENLHLLQNDFCNTIEVEADIICADCQFGFDPLADFQLGVYATWYLIEISGNSLFAMERCLRPIDRLDSERPRMTSYGRCFLRKGHATLANPSGLSSRIM